MDASYYNGAPRDPWPSVADHPAEVLFREAGELGQRAYIALRVALVTGENGTIETAVENARQAAGLYHEGLREAGECPECGGLCTDPWGGRHYNTSVGCCIEPPEPDGESYRGGEAAAYAREQQIAALRVK